MSLRTRTALATVISVMLIMAMLLVAYQLIVRQAYRDLEADHAKKELARTQSVLAAEERSLDLLLTDWASWDDMYGFVETRSPAFVTSNLPANILSQLNLNALVIRNGRGENVIGRGRDGDSRIAGIAGLTDAIPNGSPLLDLGAGGHVSGLTSTPLGPMLIAVRPILRSDGGGEPRGTVIMGRLLDEAFTTRLAEMLRIGVAVLPPDSPAIPPSVRAALPAQANGTPPTWDMPGGRTAAFSHLLDLTGKPILVLRVDDERSIEAQSGATLRALLLTVGLTGIVLVIALVAVIQFTVVGRLRGLLDEMSSITGRGSSEGLRTRVTGNDEIGEVASGVNAMLDRLEAAAAERVRLEQEMSEQQRLAEEAFREVGEGLIVVDSSGTCTASNPAAERILGIRAGEVAGQPLASVLPLLHPADDVTRSAGEQFFETGARTVAVSRTSPGAPGRFSVVVLRDVTDARAVERLKRDLVATVSHELRTPLTAIQATVSMLGEGDGGALSDMQQRLVGLLDRNTDRLRVLVDDLLDMGALEGGRVTLHRTGTDLGDLCGAVVEDIRPHAERSGVTIRTDLRPVTAHVDEARTRQVIENLLQNAVKFTPSGGTVEVSTAASGDRATITVRDNGIGIAPDEIEHVFEKFYRTSNGARFAHGTGLGLSIAHSIVALHGGRLTAASDGQTGTTMTVTLPTTPAPE
ncbi:MAG: CHASE4 domain-containing protein [Dehalococcoidia bacterium]